MILSCRDVKDMIEKKIREQQEAANDMAHGKNVRDFHSMHAIHLKNLLREIDEEEARLDRESTELGR